MKDWKPIEQRRRRVMEAIAIAISAVLIFVAVLFSMWYNTQLICKEHKEVIVCR